ncbi:MAG: exodeoxyribonuclease VII large subunit, partial [Steroidobacter sp.]
KRRFPSIPVLIYPVAVQGKEAAAQIVSAIQLAGARKDCDVLILARGGGSLEDLWSFNEEIVAHAIFNCRIPIISGVGHEIDFTIADFVADVRAPTPSAAAELAVPDQQAWLRGIQVMQQRLFLSLQRLMGTQRELFAWLIKRLQQLHPGIQVRQRSQRVDELEQRLIRAWQFDIEQRKRMLSVRQSTLQSHSPRLRLTEARNELQRLHVQLQNLMHAQLNRWQNKLGITSRTLDTLSPLATLTRGYAIVTNANGQVINNANTVRVGDMITTKLAKGKIVATVGEVDAEIE